MFGKLEEFGRWIQAISLSAAGNGEQAEQAAVANSVAVLAMPTIAEAVQQRMSHDVMTSLAAYNGAILNGHFAELDEAETTAQANASAVMYQYEESCAEMAAPWEQPVPPDVCSGAALLAERDATKAGEKDAGNGDGVVSRSSGAVVVPAPLAPFRANDVKSSGDRKELKPAGASGGGSGAGGLGGMGTGYGPMAGLARGDANREHESHVSAGTLDGGGEPGADLSDSGTSWLPAAQQSDAPFMVSSVSWGPNTSVFDELAVSDQPDVPAFADEPGPTLEQVTSGWVAPPVIGADKGLTL
jgi:hypothetical protein